MVEFGLDEALTAMKGERATEGAWRVFEGVATDSRRVAGGELFFALKGPNFDGHAFVREAVERGARGVVVSSRETVSTLPHSAVAILVDDTLAALQRLAAHHRQKLGLLVLAVTGSTGKTTTKDMIHAIFSERMRCLKTQENLNNELGVPLTLLGIEPRHEVCVVELAMRGRGQIRQLAEMARPDVGVVTNVGPSHLALLGSIENVAAAKGELVESLEPEGIAVLNADCPYTAAMAGRTRAKAVLFGKDNAADVTARDLEQLGADGTEFTMVYGQRAFRVRVPVPGAHNVQNALAAGACALTLGVDSDAVASGLRRFRPERGRLNVIETRAGVTVIDDAYNANPASMHAALDVLRQARPARRRIAVLGNMLELGESAEEAHRDVGRAAARSCDVLVTVGDLARLSAMEAVRVGMPGDCVIALDSTDEAVATLGRMTRSGDVILVKGSHAMRMEEIVGALVSGNGGGSGVS